MAFRSWGSNPLSSHHELTDRRHETPQPGRRGVKSSPGQRRDHDRRTPPPTPRTKRPHQALRRLGHRAALGRRAGTSWACHTDGDITGHRYPADDVPVSVGRHPHRSLVHQDRPTPWHGSTGCTATTCSCPSLSMRSGSRRERRHQERHRPARLDDGEHREHVRHQSGRSAFRLERGGRHRQPDSTRGTSHCTCGSWRPGTRFSARSAPSTGAQRTGLGSRERQFEGAGPALLALQRTSGREARPGAVW